MLVKSIILVETVFFITLKVESQGAQRRGLVRILLAPQRDDRGQILPFVEQRNLFIELDKFIVDCEFFVVLPSNSFISRACREYYKEHRTKVKYIKN
jgi:Hemocyanin, ig-like domain